MLQFWWRSQKINNELHRQLTIKVTLSCCKGKRIVQSSNTEIRNRPRCYLQATDTCNKQQPFFSAHSISGHFCTSVRRNLLQKNRKHFLQQIAHREMQINNWVTFTKLTSVKGEAKVRNEIETRPLASKWSA